MKLISLRGLIVFPFVALAVAAAAVIYLFSTVTLNNVSDKVGLHYMQEIESRVYDRVTEFMAPLSILAELNQQAITHHPEWLEDLDRFGGRLYEQVVPYPYMTFVSLATEDGRYINSTRDPFGKAEHHLATNYTVSSRSLAAFEYDPIDYVGKQIESEPVYAHYDPRLRPFYQDAVRAKGMVWSSISPYFGYRSLGVGLSVPIYSQQGDLLGVTATSIALIALDQYLQSIELMDNSYVFLAESNGDLIASSHNQELYTKSGGLTKRVSLSEHVNPVLKQASQSLTVGMHSLEIDGKQYLYNVRPIELPYGKTWYVGVVIPNAYYKSMLSEFSEALIAILIVLFISIALVGSLIARFIGKPIVQFNHAVNASSLAHIRLLPTSLSRVREIHFLGQGLKGMANTLSDTLQNLEQKVAQRTSLLKSENELLLEQCTKDELTGLYNRRGFNLLSEQAFQQTQQQNQSLSIVLCDIDHFKKINDTLGHSVGDLALTLVANVLQDNFRSHDIVARYGGEEFMLVMVNMAQEEVFDRLENVRQTLNEQSLQQDFNVTLSFGFVHLPMPSRKSLDQLIDEVDNKLYKAKKTGRDKIVG